MEQRLQFCISHFKLLLDGPNHIHVSTTTACFYCMVTNIFLKLGVKLWSHMTSLQSPLTLYDDIMTNSKRWHRITQNQENLWLILIFQQNIAVRWQNFTYFNQSLIHYMVVYLLAWFGEIW